jgi:hypothetical protein
MSPFTVGLRVSNDCGVTSQGLGTFRIGSARGGGIAFEGGMGER